MKQKLSFHYFYLFLIIALSSCKNGETPAQAPASPLTGSWSLEEWTSEKPNGEKIYPYGQNAYGNLIYTENGQMSAIFMEQNRKGFASDDPNLRTCEELKHAFNTCFSYSGTYQVELDSGFVRHQVEACSNPDWIGKTQIRYFELKDGKLILTTPPIKTAKTESKALSHHLEWQRS